MDCNYPIKSEDLEKLSTLLSLVGIYLGAKQWISTWPLSIVVSFINLWIYYVKGLYGSIITNVLCIAISCYGWYKWRYGGPRKQALVMITRTSQREGIGLLVGLLLYIALIFPIPITSSVPSVHFTSLVFSFL